MKLLYTPGACSIGIHLILEEIGHPYESERVDIRAGATRTPEFRAINPKGKIPVLIKDDGTALTEFPAIAFYLAWTFPEKNLLPSDVDEAARALELFEYLVSTVHMRGLHRMFGPGRIAPGADEQGVWQEGRDIVTTAFALIDEQLGQKPYAMGEFSIVDGPMLYVLINAHRLEVPLPPNLLRYFLGLLKRPAVRQVIRAEGLEQWLQPELRELLGDLP